MRRLEVGRDRWDDFVDRSPDAWLWHRYDLCAALETWSDVADLSFGLVDDEERLVGILPLRRTSSHRARGRLTFSRLDSLGGPALDPSIPDKARIAELERLLTQASTDVAVPRDTELKVALSPLTPSLRGPDCPRVNPLLELGCEDVSTQSWIVDLRVDEELLWKGVKDRSRRAIRRAEKAGVELRIADRPGDLDAYYQLHIENYERTGAATHPRAYFEAIWSRFVSTGTAIVYLAELDGEVIAGRNFSVYKDAALYWTGASSERALEVGANHLLQWRAMLSLRKQGTAWSETGEAFPGGRGKDQGLTYFKQGFGGELFPFFKGRIALPSRLFTALEGLRLLKSAATR